MIRFIWAAPMPAARPGDARQVTLALTAAGETLYGEIFPLTKQVNLELLDAIGDKEVAQLDDMLMRLEQRSRQMAARGGLPLADRRRGGSARNRQAPALHDAKEASNGN
ncbi:MarR family winged helix-turn-helix transcriptional regulator [Cupriavidus basilensis]|nr:MarR family winged helix-turn-helix transcriptional regulator [Cupriavidus basilensis]